MDDEYDIYRLMMEIDTLPLETKMQKRFDNLETMIDELHERFDDFEDRVLTALDTVITEMSARKAP